MSTRNQVVEEFYGERNLIFFVTSKDHGEINHFFSWTNDLKRIFAYKTYWSSSLDVFCVSVNLEINFSGFYKKAKA